MRWLLAIALIAHGLAHASAGMWASDIGGHTLVAILWEGASIGFIAAGIGLLGIQPFERWWGRLVAIAAISSLALLLLFSHPLFTPGIVADFIAVALVIWSETRRGSYAVVAPHKITQRLLIAFMIYVAVIIGLRPWYTAWGSTRSEQQMPVIGDPPLGESHYRIDHAITINAPADSVWPWLVQIGQDRGGFYSYDWLERAFGADIHNSDRIVPEWQERRVGDLVRVVQPAYLGGILGDSLGWNIDDIEPGRAIVLHGWGAFVLSPTGPNTTRMHIRTRGAGVPTLSGVALTPVGLLVFEPAHFIMERAMLRGIKARAEKAVASAPISE